MATIELYNLGSAGIYKDIPPHLLPPEVWTDGQNMRMKDGFAQRSLGYSQVFGTPTVVPGFLLNVPALTSSFWLYASLTKVYGYDAGVHTEITRSSGGNYAAANYRDWNGCILGGIPILNNYVDVPQYWPTLTLATHLAALSNWPSTLRAKLIRNFGKFLVALNLNDNGTLLAHAVRWSHPADPGTVPTSWDVTDATKDTGQTHLTDIRGGDIQDGVLFGQQLMIYKQNSFHAMRFIGGSDIFGFDKVADIGILGARCAASIDGGRRHLLLGDDNVYVHSGTKEVTYPLESRDRSFLFGDMDTTNYKNSFVLDNPIFSEAWICYPSSGSTYPNKKLVWNYRKDTIHFDSFDGTTADYGSFTDSFGTTWNSITGSWDSQANPWAQAAGRRRLVVGSPVNTKIWGQDTGYPFGSNVTTSFLQRTGLAVTGKDRQGNPKADFKSDKLFKRIWPKITGNAVVSVRLGSQDEIGGAVTWAAAQTYDPVQKYLDFEVNGRLGAVEMSSVSDLNWQVEGYDLELEVLANL